MGLGRIRIDRRLAYVFFLAEVSNVLTRGKGWTMETVPDGTGSKRFVNRKSKYCTRIVVCDPRQRRGQMRKLKDDRLDVKMLEVFGASKGNLKKIEDFRQLEEARDTLVNAFMKLME